MDLVIDELIVSHLFWFANLCVFLLNLIYEEFDDFIIWLDLKIEEFKSFLFDLNWGWKKSYVVWYMRLRIVICYVYMIDMAGRQWVCGWSPTGRNGGDIYILRLRWIPRSIGGRMMCSPSWVWGHSLIKEGDGFLLMWLWPSDAL